MRHPTVVILAPQALSDRAREGIRHAIDDWTASDRQRALVLDDGLRIGVIGGLAVTVELTDGPIGGIRLGLTLPALADLPDRFEWEGGSYDRWLTDDGAQMHTVDGCASYRWSPR